MSVWFVRGRYIQVYMYVYITTYLLVHPLRPVLGWKVMYHHFLWLDAPKLCHRTRIFLQ